MSICSLKVDPWIERLFEIKFLIDLGNTCTRSVNYGHIFIPLQELPGIFTLYSTFRGLIDTLSLLYWRMLKQTQFSSTNNLAIYIRVESPSILLFAIDKMDVSRRMRLSNKYYFVQLVRGLFRNISSFSCIKQIFHINVKILYERIKEHPSSNLWTDANVSQRTITNRVDWIKVTEM